MCHFISFDVTFETHPESFFLPSSEKPLAISTFQRQVQRIVRLFDDTRRSDDRPLSCIPTLQRSASARACRSLIVFSRFMREENVAVSYSNFHSYYCCQFRTGSPHIRQSKASTCQLSLDFIDEPIEIATGYRSPERRSESTYLAT